MARQKFLTKELHRKLREASPDNMRPIVKFFNPMGAATWLICYLEPDDDVAWGYADLGMGCVEFGTISLKELQSIKLKFGLYIERDYHFQDKPEVNWLEKASLAGA